MLVRHVQKLNRSLRKKSLKASFERANRNLPNDIMRLPDGIELKVSNATIRHNFEYFCFRDPEVAAEYKSFVRHSKACSRLLDVGAAEGFFSLAFALGAMHRRVLAVEPNDLALGQLEHHIRSNGLNGRVSATHASLSDHTEPGVMTGDTLCKDTGFAPDAIKIDVEGQEVKVISGLAETIQRYRPIVFLEIHPQLIINEGDTIGHLLPRGYEVHKTSGARMNPSAVLALKKVTRVVLKPAAIAADQ